MTVPGHTFDYVDLFAGIGGFHAALSALGGRCVYVSEINPLATQVYRRNWGDDVVQVDPGLPPIRGDINLDAPQGTAGCDGPVRVPAHDVLAAGFPCQAFSKSGAQRGVLDSTRGTLFFNIIRVLAERRPKVVFLENVRNLAGPKHRSTWDTIIGSLEELGYEVAHAPMVVSPHLIDPKDGGTPQVRDRVFIMAVHRGADRRPARQTPVTIDRAALVASAPRWDLATTAIGWLGGQPVLQDPTEIDHPERYALTPSEVTWIDAWDTFVRFMREAGADLPGHPIWTDWFITERELVADRRRHREVEAMPAWKSAYVWKNIGFYEQNRATVLRWQAHETMTGFATFPPSRRKFEWQAQDTETLWQCLMHLRPSGIRAKKPTYVPALVAITQTTVVGPLRRRLTPVEATRLQGLPDEFTFGDQPDAATYAQLGNGVAAGAVHYALRMFVTRYADELRPTLPGLVAAVEAAAHTGWVPPIPASAQHVLAGVGAES
ncbi:MAG: DNA cytosine methyltransferase [Micrococcales bacterium]|nr:DNA cytosine methyltransferase [Micrococcales bacterium]